MFTAAKFGGRTFSVSHLQTSVQPLEIEMQMTLPRTAIVGFGGFGQLVARHLAEHAHVCVVDPSPIAQRAAAAMGLECCSLGETGSCEWVILAVPLRILPSVLEELAIVVRPGTLVLDVVSVKEEPALLMQSILPDHVELLATHPLFGPQTALAGLHGAKIVLCPLRGKKWRFVAVLLRRAKLRVLRMTPQEHDREAAVGQAIVHLLAQAFREIEIPRAVTTRSFDQLLAALSFVRDDPPDVVSAVLYGNAHAKKIGARLAAAVYQVSRNEPHVDFPCPVQPAI